MQNAEHGHSAQNPLKICDLNVVTQHYNNQKTTSYQKVNLFLLHMRNAGAVESGIKSISMNKKCISCFKQNMKKKKQKNAVSWDDVDKNRPTDHLHSLAQSFQFSQIVKSSVDEWPVNVFHRSISIFVTLLPNGGRVFFFCTRRKNKRKRQSSVCVCGCFQLRVKTIEVVIKHQLYSVHTTIQHRQVLFIHLRKITFIH